ncbi:N/A [soil metagenome]
MDANSFRTFRRHMNAVPLARWGASLASLASAVFFVLLLPLVFLTVDHLIWKGVIPPYSGLTPSRQQSFREEWQGGNSLKQFVETGEMWEQHWQRSIVNKLRDHVGPEAAETYANVTSEGSLEHTGHRVGMLSLIARERSTWSSNLYCTLARWFPITWHGPDANTAYMTVLFLAAVILLLLHTLCILAAEYWAAEASLEVGTKMRRTIYAHATRLGQLTAKPQAAREAADLFTNKVETVQDGVRAWLRAGLWAPTAIVLLLILLLTINPGLTLCFLFAGSLVWLVLGQYAARFAREGRVASRRSEARMAQMRESVHYLQLVKSYLMDRFSQTRLERQLTDYSRAEWKRLRGVALSRPLFFSVSTLTAVGVLYLAGRTVLAGQLSMAGLTMKVVAIVFLVVALRAWIAARIRLRRAQSASLTIAEFLDRRVDPGQAIDAEFLQPMKKKLDVVEASVRESGTGRMLLENVSFSVPAGSRVAVIASDDAERRALIALLGRFVETTGGEVRIDGKNVRWVTLESLRTQVALVAQPHTIFTDTVANNIGCGDAGFSPPQIIEAAKLAHAHQFVQKLQFGYETLIGDGGTSLRPGEKLRLGLARALLRDPSLVVVDEPREVMDADSQDLLDDTYERVAVSGRTFLFFTQRESILKRADHVIVIHNGTVALAGLHENLMDGSDLYRRLVFKEMLVTA